MRDSILDLIEHDIHISRFLYYQRRYLGIDAERLNTHSPRVIFALMRIHYSDEAFQQYYDLVSSAYFLEGSELTALKEVTFNFLVSLQRNPETRITGAETIKLGELTMKYSW